MAALTMGSGLSAPGFRRQLLVLGDRFWAINAGRELKSKWLNPVTHNVYTCTFRIEMCTIDSHLAESGRYSSVLGDPAMTKHPLSRKDSLCSCSLFLVMRSEERRVGKECRS